MGGIGFDGEGGCWKKLYSDAGGVPHMSPHAPPTMGNPDPCDEYHKTWSGG